MDLIAVPKNATSSLISLIKKNIYCSPITTKSNDPCFGNIVNCLTYHESFRSFDNCQIDSSATPTNFHTATIDFELLYNEISIAHLEQNRGIFNIKNFAQMKEIIVGFDERSMQLPGLLVYLHQFVNFHNLVFNELKTFNPSKTVQALGFEARKITTAVFQNIFLDFFKSVLRMYKGLTFMTSYFYQMIFLPHFAALCNFKDFLKHHTVYHIMTDPNPSP